MRRVIIAIVLLISVTISYAQETPEKMGLFIHYTYNWHKTDFRTLPGVNTCCTKFQDGTGSGVSFGGLYEYPVAKNLWVAGRLGYYMKNGTLTKDNNAVVNIDGDSALGTFRSSFDLNLSIIALEPLLVYNFFDNFTIHAGFQLGFIAGKSFKHTEKLIKPDVGTYNNLSRERLVQDGSLADVSTLLISAVGGIRYEIPLTKDKKWSLAPEIFYDYGLTKPVKDSTWNINSLRAGLAFIYTPQQKTKSSLWADINAVGLDRDSVEKPFVNMIVEEFLSTQLQPLLSYVFFDENSSVIKDKYKKLNKEETKNFRIDKLHGTSTMDIYYNVMNIIARRLIEHPEAKIKITGCNSNSGVEKNNIELSKKRAEIVRDYFLNVWEIEPDRLVLLERNLPQEPSNEKEADGITENRRVEISSNTWEVIAPIVTNDTVRIANPPMVRFKPQSKSDAGITDWDITAYQNGKLLKSITGKAVPEQYDWKLRFNDIALPNSNDIMTYKLTVKDKENQTFETIEKQLPVQQVTISKKRQNKVKDKYVDRFSLILFQFDESKLSYYNSLIANEIQKRIQPDSKISMTGHTDRMGDYNHNLELSITRSKALAQGIKSDNILLYGSGENELLYDNDLPEGRFYCRRVDVVIETPIKE